MLAKIFLNDKINFIEVDEDLYYKSRIINELATMALEKSPMLHPKEELKNVPYIFWNTDDFEDEEENKIQAILEVKEEEFNNLLYKEVIKQLKLKLKKKQYLYMFEDYQINAEDKAKGIVIACSIEICED